MWGTAWLSCLALASTVLADVKLPALISDSMLLQANKPAAIWGFAEAGEKVTVGFAGQSAEATADAQGRWKVSLKPLKADTCGALTVTGKNTLTINNVLVGTVWICSGQSNMEMGIGMADHAETELPKANYPKMRLFRVKNASKLQPQTDVEGQWVECSPETLPLQGGWGGFSAVAYYFGRDIHLATGLPVGLIETCWGGTPAQSWTSLASLQEAQELKGYVEQYEALVKNLPAVKVKYEQDRAEFQVNYKKWEEAVNKPYQAALKAWDAESARTKSEGKPAPAKPALASPAPKNIGAEPDNNPWTPTSLYNGMIHPLISYAIEGAIWYQGESNAGKALEYRTLFPVMISDWRKQWGQGDFSFYFCQLANFLPKTARADDGGWASLREAQSLTRRLPNTGQAVLIDIGEASDIHPRNKREVGSRLAKIALAKDFGKSGRYTGPVYSAMKVEGDKIRLSFDPVGGELVARDVPATYDVKTVQNETAPLVRNRPGSPLEGFAICGEDRKWVWADAAIDGQTVLVSAPEVKQPVAVRYCWASNPTGNLYNKDGLPASPFQTDVRTDGK
jgi:sialate O-acetylesterase